jgi:hypothetical protein
MNFARAAFGIVISSRSSASRHCIVEDPDIEDASIVPLHLAAFCRAGAAHPRSKNGS